MNFEQFLKRMDERTGEELEVFAATLAHGEYQTTPEELDLLVAGLIKLPAEEIRAFMKVLCDQLPKDALAVWNYRLNEHPLRAALWEACVADLSSPPTSETKSPGEGPQPVPPHTDE